MATQPETAPSPGQQRRNAAILCEVLHKDEARLRLQARRHCERPVDVDDVLQTAYAQFIERYRGAGEPLAWLYTTVKREAWAVRRRGLRHRERSTLAGDVSGRSLDLPDALPTDHPGPEERAELDEQLTERRQALASLKADEQKALWLFGMGYSYAEIGEIAGWTYTKVNRCISEGRAALKRAEDGSLGLDPPPTSLDKRT